MSSATVDIIVTMGSYRAFVRFLNSLRTRMKSFFVSSESTLMHRNRYAVRKDRFCEQPQRHMSKEAVEEQWTLKRHTNKSRYAVKKHVTLTSQDTQ